MSLGDRYEKHYKSWKKTLGEGATEEELHAKALSHLMWEEKNISPEMLAPKAEKKYDAPLFPNIWYFRIIIILLVLILGALLARPARAQFSHVTFINWQQGGTNIPGAFFTYPFNVNCSTNLTCAVSGNTLTMTGSGGAGSGCIPPGTTATAFLFDAGGGLCSDVTKFTWTSGSATITLTSGGTLDLGGGLLVKQRFSAGLTTSTNGDFGYDTTAATWHAWQNGVDRLFIAATNIGNVGQPCLSNGDGSCTNADPIVSGPDAVGAAPTRNPVQIGCLFLTTPATLTNNQVGEAQCDSTQHLFVNVTNFPGTQPVSGTVAATQSGTWTVQQGGAPWSVSQSGSPWGMNLTQVAGTALGATAVTNFGTAPAAAAVPGVNASLFSGTTALGQTGGALNINISSGALPTGANTIGKVDVLGNAGATLDVAQGGATAATNAVQTAGVFNTTLPTLTTGQAGAIQLDAKGQQLIDLNYVAGTALGTPQTFGTAPTGVVIGTSSDNYFAGTRSRSNQTTTAAGVADVNVVGFLGTTAINDGTAGVEAVGGHLSDNGVAAATNRIPVLAGIVRNDYHGGTASTAGRDAAPDVGTDGLLHATLLPDMSVKRYKASSKFAASSTTDNWRISGNASNTAVVTKVILTCTETTAGQINVEVRKESTATSGGTPATVTNLPVDSNKAAAASVVQSFTGTGPTVGTLVADLDNAQIGCMAAATATPNDLYTNLNAPGAPFAVLRGTAEGVAINLGGALTGGNITVTVEWMEITTITP